MWIARIIATALALTAAAIAAQAQALYHGELGGQPVTLMVEESNAVARGVYFYDRHRTPIRLKPTFTFQTAHFTMDELDTAGLPAAQFNFDLGEFWPANPDVTGIWTNYRDGRRLPFKLHLTAYVDLHKRIPIEAFSQIQAASTARFYFAIPVMREYDPASAIAVYDKRTGQRVQVLHLKSPGCDNGVDTVLVTTEQGKEQLRIAAPQTYCAEARFELNPKTQRFHDIEPGSTRLTSPY